MVSVAGGIFGAWWLAWDPHTLPALFDILRVHMDVYIMGPQLASSPSPGILWPRVFLETRVSTLF